MEINYIETTLNGYITKRIKLADYVKGKDYCGELFFEMDGEEWEYYNDVCGDFDILDEFLAKGSNVDIVEYQEENHLGTKENVLLEYYKTDMIGFYTDKYIGIEIKRKRD